MQEGDAGILQHLIHGLGNFFVFTWEDHLPTVQHRDLGTEAIKHGGEFQADWSSTHDQQGFRTRLHLLDRGAGVHLRGIAAGDPRHHGHGTSVDDDGFRLHPQGVALVRDFNFLGPHETTAPRYQSDGRNVREHAVVYSAELLDQLVAAFNSL